MRMELHAYSTALKKFSAYLHDIAYNFSDLTIEEDVTNASSEPSRPFPSSRLPPLQNESKCKVFVMVNSSTLHMNKN